MRVQIPPDPPNIHATVAKLAYALRSECSGLTPVEVQLLSVAPNLSGRVARITMLAS